MKKFKQNHMMIDLETMATTPDTVVLTLGAVKFSPFNDDREKENRANEKLYLKFDIDLQQDDGRVIDDDTLAWWGKQPEAVFEEAFSEDNRITLKAGLIELRKFWHEGTKSRYVWGHGCGFDMTILEHCFRQVGEPIPWDFWNVRDTRTMFDLGFDHNMPMDGHHHALADAMRQVIGVQNIYRELGLKK